MTIQQQQQQQQQLRKQPLHAYRRLAELRKAGGLLMFFGLAVFIYPLESISTVIRDSETLLVSNLHACRLFGNMFLMFIGFLAIATGYLQIVQDWGNKFLARYATVVTQAGWVVFLVDIIDVVIHASGRYGLIPSDYSPTAADYQAVAGCAVVGLVANGIALMGSLSYLNSIIFSIHSNMQEERKNDAELRMYSLALFLAGVSQFMIGGYLMTTPAYEFGLQEHGPITAPLFSIHNPALNLAFGTGQICNGVWGILRSTGTGFGGGFYASMLAGWAVQVVTIFHAQRANDTDAVASSAASFIVAATVLHLMPLMMDGMMLHSDADAMAKFKTSAPSFV